MSASTPAVSVVIATYNWSSVLRYAIHSVLAQSFRDFELLVVGDACTDDSAEVAAAFGDPRIRWFNLERNSGSQSAPNNRGIAEARGRYVAYLGHDDLWYPNHVEVLVRAIEAKQADFASSVVNMIGPPGSGYRMLIGAVPDGKSRPFVPPSGLMHRRDAVARIGSWRDYRELHLPPDREFVYRAWDHGLGFVFVPEITVFKFNSAWRPGSYARRSCEEQAEYLARMFGEEDFMERERKAIDEAYAAGRNSVPPEVRIPPPPENAPRGWAVEQMRRIRGLPPGVPAAEVSGVRDGEPDQG